MRLKFVQGLLDVARKIRYYKIKRSDKLENIVPKGSYNRPGSLEFFRHVKRNNIRDVESILQDDRFMIYQHDETKQTALHIAAKRNLMPLARLLIKAGSDVNARDINGRGPLYNAVIGGFKEMTDLLIANMASVFAFDHHGN